MESMPERIAKLTGAAIDAIEAEYPTASVGCAVLVCDLIVAAEDGPLNPIVVFANDPRRWVQLAILEEAVTEANALNERRVAEVEEDTD